MVETFSSLSTWTCTISILRTVGERSAFKHYDKTKEKYVFQTFFSCITCRTSFDLCMSHVGYDITLCCQLYHHFFGAHPSDYWSFWGVKYN
jgi:hypothetical protein